MWLKKPTDLNVDPKWINIINAKSIYSSSRTLIENHSDQHSNVVNLVIKNGV
jgi:hypothetical protein